jgi:glycosyltransferase involved in cell wall biosynthesis
LLTLATLFPNARQPRHGIFIANRLAKMRDTGRIDATVVAAVPWFPGAYREWAAVPRSETILGMPVRHPRYLNVPAMGMRRQPDALARALLEDLRRAGLHADRFDAIDAHYFYPDGVAAARVARALGLPLVVSARGSDINLIGGMRFARQRMLLAAQRAQALIAVSAALAAKMSSLGMPRERIEVLRNGVDTSVFFPVARADARQRLGLRSQRAWVLGVGNLVREKGFDLLIRAVAKIPDARLLIVGEGPLGRSLRALAHGAAPGRVEFRDNMTQSDLRFAYAACNVLGLPSLREGWPNVVLESIACGTSVVAAPVGGVPEILAGDAPALMVHARDADAWAAALTQMLARAPSPEDVHRYALAFAWEEVISAQCALYERVALADASLRKRRPA